jgi:hypothetical protein
MELWNGMVDEDPMELWIGPMTLEKFLLFRIGLCVALGEDPMELWIGMVDEDPMELRPCVALENLLFLRPCDTLDEVELRLGPCVALENFLFVWTGAGPSTLDEDPMELRLGLCTVSAEGLEDRRGLRRTLFKDRRN